MIRIVRVSTTVLLAAVLTAGACAKKKVEPPVVPPTPPPPAAKTTPTTPPPPPPAPPTPTPAPAPLTEDEIYDRMTLDELNRKGVLGDVFFALDSIEITSEGRATLQKNFEFMKRRMSTRVMVEGHADSRGTNEYNLALGERRAGAVREYLVGLGLDGGRITTVSKGEEQPQCADETESCWQKNRRGAFVFTAK